MAFSRKTHVLAGDTPGTQTTLTWFEIGPAGAAAKVYLQAALHADETPGIMVLHHLLRLLRAADDSDRLRARFVVMPAVNPLGLQSLTLRTHIGRYDPATGVNHNRRWPDLFSSLRQNLSGRLGDDPDFNVNLIRKAVAQWIDQQRPTTAAEELRLIVLRETHDADLVLDLHCDSDSLIHIFTSPELGEELSDLADWIGAAATLTAADSGGGSFDEVYPLLYRRVASVNPTKPLPLATVTATLEYRGRGDTFDSLGEDDARRLFGFFAARGLIEADPGAAPASAPAATPLEATEIVRADRPGLLAYRVDLGERVTRGQPIADLIALDGPEAFVARTPILAGTDGTVLSRVQDKYVRRGGIVAKIVGTVPLQSRKGAYLLED